MKRIYLTYLNDLMEFLLYYNKISLISLPMSGCYQSIKVMGASKHELITDLYILDVTMVVKKLKH